MPVIIFVTFKDLLIHLATLFAVDNNTDGRAVAHFFLRHQPMQLPPRLIDVAEGWCHSLTAPAKVVDAAPYIGYFVRNVDDKYQRFKSNCLKDGRQNLLACLIGAKVPHAQLRISL